MVGIMMVSRRVITMRTSPTTTRHDAASERHRSPMIHLTPDQLTELHADLDRQLVRLIKSMEVTAAALEPVKLDQTAVGRLSRIDSLQNQSLARSLGEREQVKLAQIQEALQRMEQGTYGNCTGCGAPLPFQRLSVFPEAPTCAGC